MTHIKSLKIHGFKSFAKPTELTFNKELSVIVGPNGAGKSNITDAICFVLGRLGMKSMRTKHASSLIYHGGHSNRPADEARVEMVLDNSDKVFAFDENDVKIERIVRTDGNSVYRINNKTKTRQEILELLGQAGIDPMGFNIILQGEISRFVEMHAEERRLVIEEIAGINVYEDRKAKSFNELQKTDEKLKEVSIILSERRTFLKNLEEERGEALKYKKHEETIKKAQATLLHKDFEDKGKNIENIDEELGKKLKFIEGKREKIKKGNAEVEKLRTEALNIGNKIREETGLEQEKLQQEVIELKQQLAGLGVKKENYVLQIEEKKRRKEQLEKSIPEYEYEIEELRKAKPKAASKSRQELEKKKKELEDIEKKRGDFYKIKQKYSEIKGKLQNKKEILQRIKNQSEFVFKRLEESSSELSEINEDIDAVTKKLDELKNKHDENKSMVEKNHELILELEKNIFKEENEIIKQQKIKHDVSKIDVCPLCKTKITPEHVGHVIEDAERICEECDKKVIEMRKKLDELKDINSRLKAEIEEHSGIINKKEYDIKHIKNIGSHKEHLAKLKEEEEKSISEIEELGKQDEKLEKQFLDFGNIEELYENLRLEVQELNEIPSEDKDAKISLKAIELERSKNNIRSIEREMEDVETSLNEISSEIEGKEDILGDKEKKQQTIHQKYQSLLNKKSYYQDRINNLEKEQIRIEGEINQEGDSSNNFKIDKARLNAEQETIALKMKEFESIELLQGSREKIQEQLKNAQETLIRLGNVNMHALQVYDGIKVQYDEIAEKAQKLEVEKQEIMNIIADIDKKKKKAFMNVFNAINEKFMQNWGKLSVKGPARLELDNEENPFEGGISIAQKIAKGSYTDASLLSGGERVLMALSLIFAIQEYKPYHFYIFDEIDAALDKRNTERLAGLIKNCAGKAQYIIITHNDSVISECGDYLYGITMQDGISKVLSLKI